MSIFTEKQVFTKQEKLNAIKKLYETWKISHDRKNLLIKLNW